MKGKKFLCYGVMGKKKEKRRVGLSPKDFLMWWNNTRKVYNVQMYADVEKQAYLCCMFFTAEFIANLNSYMCMHALASTQEA